MKDVDGTSKALTQKVKQAFWGLKTESTADFLLGYNSGSIGIAYIGTFTKKLPNENQLKAGFLLLEEGVKLGKLTTDYKIYGHRQLIASESPGAAFYEVIKTWKHWTNKTPEVV